MVYFTNICNLWILATSRERCTCTNIGHWTASQRLSVNVTQVKGTTGVCLLIKSRLVTRAKVCQINPTVGTVRKVPNWLVLRCTIIGEFVKYTSGRNTTSDACWSASIALKALFPSLLWRSAHVQNFLPSLRSYSMEQSPSRVLLENLTGFQLVKKFPALYGTRKFLTAFTSPRHLSISWARSIQSIPPHPTSWRSILILSSHLRLGLPSGRFPSGSELPSFLPFLLHGTESF